MDLYLGLGYERANTVVQVSLVIASWKVGRRRCWDRTQMVKWILFAFLIATSLPATAAAARC